MWLGTAPSSAPSATPVFKLDVVESPKRPAPALPSVTVVETPLGPRMSNLALKFPSITIADRVVASQLGDQTLPRTFSSSPWAGNAVKRPMRGLSLSTAGTTPVTFLFGQLDPTSRQPASSNAPGVVALAMGVTSSKELSVTPRALVPVGSQTAQSSVGTAIRADVSRHVSLVSDVGAAGTTQLAGIRSPLPVLSGIGVERKSKRICCAARRRSVHQMSPLSGRSIARSSVVSCGPFLA